MVDGAPPVQAAATGVPFVDLVLGAWRPREAAAQLAHALGVSLPEWQAASGAADGIEAEAAPEPMIAWAYAAAARIAAKVPSGGAVAVLAPRFGQPLRPDDEWLLLFLRRRIASIALIGDEPATSATGRPVFERRRGIEPPPVQASGPPLSEAQQRVLRFFPGLLPRSLAGDLGIGGAVLVPAGRDHFLIPPAWRDADPKAAGRDLDAMEAVEKADEGFMALAQTFCTAHFADGAGILALSRRMEDQGAVWLAAGLAERARQVARTPEAMAEADVRRLEVWRTEGRHADMLSLPPPSRLASEAARARLARLRLEAAVATGRVGDAEAGMTPLCRRLEEGDPIADEDLLLLDAFAAALGSGGEADRAAKIAGRLAARAEGAPSGQALAFRYAMTRARLHDRHGEAEPRRAALEAAFATSAGIRSLGEVVEMNALRAAGTETSPPAARSAWLRAALAWLAFEEAEALPPGAIRAVLGEGRIHRPRLELDLSDALSDRLAAAWPDLDVRQDESYPAVRAQRVSDRPRRLFGGAGAAVLWLDPGGAGPVYIRPRARLSRLVGAALTALCPDLGRRGNGTILVDTNLGLDIPADRDPALSVALRAKVDDVVFGEEVIGVNVASRARMAARLVACLGPAVRNVEGNEKRLVLRFRRRLPDVVLAGEEAAAVAPLRGGERLPLGSLAVILGKTVVEAEALCRQVELLRVLRLDYEEPVAASGRTSAAAGPKDDDAQ